MSIITTEDYKGFYRLPFNSGSENIDNAQLELFTEFIDQYEPEYFERMFTNTFYQSLVADPTHDLIESIKKATALYVLCQYIRHNDVNYNGQTSVQNYSETDTPKANTIKYSLIWNEMVKVNRYIFANIIDDGTNNYETCLFEFEW